MGDNPQDPMIDGGVVDTEGLTEAEAQQLQGAEKPWPFGEPTDEEKFWHLDWSPAFPDQKKTIYWWPVKGGKLYTLYYQDGSPSIAPTLTYVPSPEVWVGRKK